MTPRLKQKFTDEVKPKLAEQAGTKNPFALPKLEKIVISSGMGKHLDGTKVRPTYDERQVGDERLSSVQYLAFEIGPEAPVAIGIDFAGIDARTELSAAQREALQKDLDA